MNRLSEDYIKRLAVDDATFIRGLKLYKTDNVIQFKKLDTIYKDADSLSFSAKVLGTSKTYDVNAKLNKEGEHISSSCECKTYYTSQGNCAHITATLLYIKEHYFHNEKTNEDLKQVVEFYKRKKTLNVNLVPTFIVTYDRCSGIELKIGLDQYYVVKDIKRLFELIKTNSFFEYGKNLAFDHSLDAFSLKSKQLLKIIEEEALTRQSNAYYYTFDNKRYLQLVESNFDKVLKLYASEKITLTIGSIEYKIKYSDEIPPLRFSFINGKLELVDSDKITIFELISSQYVLIDTTLYSLNNLKSSNLIPLFAQLHSTGYIKINEDNSSLFFTYVWPKVKDEININGLDDLLKLNQLKELTAKIYLELKDGILYLTHEFFYDGISKQLIEERGDFVNVEQEEDFLNYLHELGFDEAFIIESEDSIYDFLTNKVEELKTKADIYVSDSIKNMSYRQMKQPQIGVRFNNNLLEVSFSDLDFDISELEKVLKAYRLKKKFYLLKDGSLLGLNEKYLSTINETLDSLNINPKKVKEVNQVEMYKAVKLENILDNIKEHYSIRSFINSLKNYDKLDYALTPEFNQTLRDYQRSGYKWLKNLAYYQLGGILADDMGLGKTVQVIALIAHDEIELPTIIISPSSLIFNWEAEFERFAPSVKTVVVEGNVSEREVLIKNSSGKRVLITSYDYLKRDIDFYDNTKFRFAIIDEAQNIKNYNTKNAQSVKSIHAQSRFALTGTPIENALSDLWSIFDFILPGYFKSYENFKDDYENQIVRNENQDALKKLTSQIAPFILRRTKKDVLSELPPKDEQVIYAKMLPEQKQIYQATLLNAKRRIDDATNNKFVMLTYLTRLRQICCDPNLVYNNYSSESPKLEITVDLITESIASNHKLLVFSQFTSMLDIIAKRLDQEGIKYLILTGDTPTKERPNLVNQFNNDDSIKVFLISLKAGGLGLNLTAADMIIHFDPWWNLSAENQASDRAHRIGQTKTVHVMKIIIKDSVEEKILKLQQRKKDLVSQVINDDEQLITKLSFHEILSLFD